MSDDEYDEDPNYNPEEEIIGDKWKLVDLPEMPTVTGEEDEEELTKFKSKLYRFRKGEWKERGVGELRFLKHKTTGLIRLLMRADKTKKIVTNHLLQKKQPFCQLSELKTSDRAWTWISYDFSDDKPIAEKLCAKFTTKEEYKRFESEFEKSCSHNAQHKKEKKEEKEEKKEEKKEQAKA